MALVAWGPALLTHHRMMPSPPSTRTSSAATLAYPGNAIPPPVPDSNLLKTRQGSGGHPPRHDGCWRRSHAAGIVWDPELPSVCRRARGKLVVALGVQHEVAPPPGRRGFCEGLAARPR